MIKEGHIGYREGIALTVILISGKIYTGFPRVMVEEGKTAAWLLVLLSTALSVVAFLPIPHLLARFPGKSYYEVVEEVAGPYLGVLALVLSSGFYLFLLGILVREFAEIVASTVLPFTPISVITIALLLVMAYGAYAGLEPLTRTAWILAPWILAGLLAVLLLSLRWAKFQYLLPFWGAGIPSLLKSSVFRTSLFVEVLLLPLLVPHLREPQRLAVMGIWSIVISGIVMSFVVLLFVTVFPVRAAVNVLFPVFQMARIMFLGRFFQRMESLFIFVWVISAAVQLAGVLQATALALARIMKLPVYRPLIFPLSVLTFAIAFIPPDLPAAIRIDDEFLRYYGAITAFGLTTTVYVVALIRGKGRKARGRVKKS